MLLQEINGNSNNHRFTVQQTLDTNTDKWDSFWLTAQNKHSNGVGIIMKHSVARYKGRIDTHKDRGISILLILPSTEKCQTPHYQHILAYKSQRQPRETSTGWLAHTNHRRRHQTYRTSDRRRLEYSNTPPKG